MTATKPAEITMRLVQTINGTRTVLAQLTGTHNQTGKLLKKIRKLGQARIRDGAATRNTLSVEWERRPRVKL